MTTQTAAAPAIKTAPRWKFGRYAYAAVVLAWLVYALLTLFAPEISNRRFQLSDSALLLLRLTIIVPIHLIWLLAMRGAVAFKNYSALIAGGKESKAIDLIANGLLWTIGYLILNSVLSATTPFFAGTSVFAPLVIIRDHLAPFFSLIAFFLIYRGSHLLRDIAGFTTWTRGTAWIVAAYSVFAFLFVLQFATAPILDGAAAGRTATSIVPHNILLFTLIVPFLSAWFMGVAALINISKYARHVKGVLYRSALVNLVRGLIVVIGFSISLQLLNFSAKYLATLQIGAILLILYALMILYATGFFLVANGARKLAKLEATQ
ncbi:MAG: hypothetical protein K0S68_724 [Candidatus Saccharibacteria bacterium]|nr:hypothetical protein [Candidatus Saccharibacteria bacterium]